MLPQISIREVCEILSLELPNNKNSDNEKPISMDKLRSVCINSWGIKNYAIFFLKNYGSGVSINNAVNAKGKMIVDHKTYRNTCGYSTTYPKGMYVKDAFTKVCEKIRLKYVIPVIAITGNAGKTTTKDLLSCIFLSEKKTLCVNKNYNTWYTTGELIQNLTNNHEIYIQEVHEPHAALCSQMLHPKVVVLTNLERAHLDETGASLEDSIKATLKILDYMDDDGIVFANNDCSYLSKEEFKGRSVVRYSAVSKDCDFWAENIENHFEYTKFTINSKAGYKADVKLNISGTHNVNNAVAAFAVAMHFGINPEKVANELEKYKPTGVRQNMIKKDGRYILIDCYSTTVLSSVATGEAFSKIPVLEGGKKIMVLSYLPTLGSGSEDVHRDVGRGISKLPIDLFVTYRNDAKYIAEECKNAGKNAVFFQYHKEMIDYLNKQLTPKDNIAFKGVTYSHLEQVANACLGLDIVPENDINSDRSHNGGDF